MELYNIVHFFYSCDKNESTGERQELYVLIVGFMEGLCRLHRQQLDSITNDRELLSEYVKRWQHFAGTAKGIRGICSYMQRFFIPSIRSPSLFLLAQMKWRDICFLGLEHRLFDQLLLLVHEQQQQQDDNILAGLAHSFANLTVCEHTEMKLHDKRQDALAEQHMRNLLSQIKDIPKSHDKEEDKKRLFILLSRLPDDSLVNEYILQQQLEELAAQKRT